MSAVEIQLAWVDNSSNESHFQVERSLSASAGFTQVGTPALNAIGWKDSGLQAGTRYFYRVRAANDWGSSAWSSTGWPSNAWRIRSARSRPRRAGGRSPWPQPPS